MNRSICVALVCATAVFHVPPALSQEEPPAKRNRGVVEEVIVTAQKREESLQDVPISMVAMSAEAMAQANIEDLEDMSAFTPNLQVFSKPPFTSVAIRGLGSPFDKGFEHSAGLFLDGVYVGRLAFIDSAFLDVASVEVLRGPQGTLFGKNTISGALSIRSVLPKNEFEITGEAHGGDRDYEKYVLTANIPVADYFAMRISALKNVRDGNTYNTTLDRDEGSRDADAFRIQGRLDVGDYVTVRAASTLIDQSFRLSDYQIQVATDDQFAVMQTYDDQVDQDPFDYRSSQDFPADTTQEGSKHDLVVSGEFISHEIALINSLTGIEELSLSDIDFSPIPLLTFLNGEDYIQNSHELRIVSPPGMLDGKLDYVGGLYYAESETDIRVFIDVAPEPDALTAGVINGSLGTSFPINTGQEGPGERLDITANQKSVSRAVYGQATWYFTDVWSLTAGLRYSRDTKGVNQVQKLFTNGTDQDGPITTQLLDAEEYTLITSRVDEDFSPKLSLGWEVTDEISAYASVAEGFKGGGYSGSAVRASRVEVDEESSVTYEIGAKSRLLEGAMTFNVAVFRTEFEDLQLTVFEGNVSRISNAAGAISEGLEIDMNFATPWGITGSLSYAYLDARFTEFRNGPCPAGVDPPCDLTGKSLARAPRHKARFSVNYTYDFNDWPIYVMAGTDYLYQDAIVLQVDQDPIDVQGAYDTINLRLRVADSEDRWSVQALWRNVENTEALDSSGDIPTQTGAHFGRAIGPRELDVSVTFRF